MYIVIRLFNADTILEDCPENLVYIACSPSFPSNALNLENQAL